MTSRLLALVEEIVTELTLLEAVPFLERSKNGEEISFPRIIDAGNGRALYVSKKLDEDIVRVATKLMENDQSLKRQFTQEDWRSVVRKAFGPALASIDLTSNKENNAEVVVDHIKESLNRLKAQNRDQQHSFGCTLFGGPSVKTFSIGPVCFELRQDWLNRKHQEGTVSRISKRRIERNWNGENLAKRKPSYDSYIETRILNAVDDCPYVCSVATQELAVDAGLEKALMAAHLALTAIALVWSTPSKALKGINLIYDGQPYNKTSLTFVTGPKLLSGVNRSHEPCGPLLQKGEWEAIFTDNSERFSLVGEVIEYVISPSGTVTRPNMMLTLVHALMWFYQGCRETMPHMSIVNFSASLDALASGHRASGICRLISARLGVKSSDPINSNGGPPLKTAIKRIYEKGRSRTIHGNNDKISHDWSDTRALSEEFARLCLVTCIDWATNNPDSDDPEQLQQ